MTTDLRDRLQSTFGGSYTLERELGGGGMARVFLAEEPALGRRVVVKVLAPELAAGLSAERFAREIRLAASLQQANIVPVLSAGVTTREATGEALPYYTMPFVEGRSLRERLHEAGGPLPLAEAVGILRDVARALDYAQARGVVHRDVKPENILLSGDTAVVTDFGIAKALSASTTHVPPAAGTHAAGTLTQAGFALGTPAYMAPEQATGDPRTDHRADLYALGVVAYEMLAGAHPFAERRSAAELVAAHLVEAPPPLAARRPAAPAELVALVMRCLAKRPEDRPPSARTVLAALDAVVPTPGSRVAVVGRPRWRGRLGAVAAAVLLVAGGWALSARRGSGADEAPGGGATAAAGAPKSVAVLPFENVGGDTANAYFADGMTDELTSALSKLPGLRVAGRTSAFAFKGQHADLRDVGRRLDVGAIVTGSVRRAGSRVRVVAQLVGAADGIALWSDTHEHDVADVFAVQDSIAAAIVGALRVRLTDAAAGVRRAGRTTSPEAHDLYLRGLALANSASSREEMEKALSLFEAAVAEDPNYALAHAGIAGIYGMLADAYLPPQEGHGRAKAAALRALRADSLLPEGHTWLGFAHAAYDWDFAAAERELRRGVELDPSSATARLLYGHILCGMGRRADGLAELEHAFRLDPLSAYASWFLELCLYLDRRYDRVLAQQRRTRELAPDFFYFDDFAGASRRETGAMAEALAAYGDAKRRTGGQPLYGLAILYARLGRVEDARRELAALEAEARRRYLPPTPIAMVYANLGERGKMLEWIGRALEVRDPLLWYNRSAPEWDRWRSDPEFVRLGERIKLPHVAPPAR